ncbi:alpha/beta hydrolase family protein [Saccharopolyspora sp. NPDC000995]
MRGAGVGGTTALGVLAHTNLCAGGTIYAGVADLPLLAEQGRRRMADHLRALAADSTLQRDPSWLRSICRLVLMLHGTRDEVVPPSQS